MKPRKLTPRFILIALVLLLAIYYLYPTFRYSSIHRTEQRIARQIAEKMDVPDAYVIENLYKDESILRDKLADIKHLSEDEKLSIADQLGRLQGTLQETALKYRKKAIKQGLDLQGGMHLLLEVDLVQLMQNLARQKDRRFERLLSEIDRLLTEDPQADFNSIVTSVFEEEGVKLSQYFGEAGESNNRILDYLAEEAEDAIDRSLEILRNRIDQFGVSEPSIQKKGARRIVLELPGVQDPARARDLIGRTALLEFKLLAEGEKFQAFMESVDAYLAKKQQASRPDDESGISFPDEESEDAGEQRESATQDESETQTEGDSDSGPVSGDEEEPFDISATIDEDTGAAEKDTGVVSIESEETPFTALLVGVQGDVAVPRENLREAKTILADPKIDELLPEGTELIWSAKPESVEGNEYHILYLVKRDAELTGSALSDARVDISSGYNSPGQAGQSVVSLTLNRQGARKFARITGANIEKRLAIVLDEKIYMAPVIRSKIPNGRAVIEGMGDPQEAKDIAIVLRAGALPTSVVIEEERTVGPSLGRDSIQKGTSSAAIGFVTVIIFMIIYYGLSGIIANVALLLNIVLIFTGLAFFGAMGMGATLSLPGIAGIILTIGMAVDANVLIFERIREELETGKTVWHAISAGYDRAFQTILDANVTTLIAALVLLQFGTGPIKGFAVTLSIGIGCSLFTAIIVTRLIFDFMTTRFNIAKLSI